MNSLFGSENMFMVDGVKILKYVSREKKSMLSLDMCIFKYNIIGKSILQFCFWA